LIETLWVERENLKAYLPHALALLSSPQFSYRPEDMSKTFVDQAATGAHAADDKICGICAANLSFQLFMTLEFFSNKAESTIWAQRALVLRKHLLGDEYHGYAAIR